MSNKYYTCEEVAQLLNVNIASIWRLIRIGELKAIAINARTKRIEEEELKRFLKERETKIEEEAK